MIVGEVIVVPSDGGETRIVVSIASDTSLDVDFYFEDTDSGQTATVMSPTLQLRGGDNSAQMRVEGNGRVWIGPLSQIKSFYGDVLHVHSDDGNPTLTAFTSGEGESAAGGTIWAEGPGLNLGALDAAGTRTDLLTLTPDFVQLATGLRLSGCFTDSSYSLETRDCSVYVDAGSGGATIFLPPQDTNRVFYIYKVAGSGDVTISPDGTDLINGVNAPKTISGQWDGVRLIGWSLERYGDCLGWIASAQPAL